jgi:hypothetical protein
MSNNIQSQLQIQCDLEFPEPASQLDINSIVAKLSNAKYATLARTYLEQLNPIECIACNIAITNLDTSFNLIKSSGFLKWLKTHEYSV